MTGAREYHERTNHLEATIREMYDGIDRDLWPRPYKVYESLPRVDPDGSPPSPERPALAAVAQATAEPPWGPTDGDPAPDIHQLAYYATGVTRELTRDGETVRFRAASCTGKLYHVDLYAVAGDCGPDGPGVYHYDPEGDGFDVLREGDFRGVLAAASGGQPGVAEAPVTFVATSTWWRNACKYNERTYRHAFWDSGTVVANLLAAAHATGHRAEAVLGFADDPVADLLGLDPTEEAPLELVPVGSGDPVPDAPGVPAIDPDEEPLSETVRAYPLVHEAWRESALADGDAAAAWRETLAGADLGTHGPGDGEMVPLDPVGPEVASARPLGNTIERRGSLREYSHDPISDRLLATVLDRALRPVPIDALGGGESSSGEGPDTRPPTRVCDAYVLVHAVEGIESGAYQYHPEQGVLERLGDTDRETATHLSMGQEPVGDAAVNVYLMADVDRVVDAAGDRGYRLAQFEAGLALGRLYLATYAHRAIGGRGFTFFDEQVTDHLSPRAASQAPMTMFAFGRPA